MGSAMGSSVMGELMVGSGQPETAPFLQIKRIVKQFDDVWWAKREEVADWYLANHASHIAPAR